MTFVSSDFTRHINSCYRSLYHFDLSNLDDKESIEVVFGDSYSEGSGEEFLSGEKNYGLFNKIYSNNQDRSILLFGRSGYGTISNYKEYKYCNDLLGKFTSLSIDKSKVDKVTFMFYEGNDLNDNLREDDIGSSHSRKFFNYIRFFIPFVDYTQMKIRKKLNSHIHKKNETDQIEYPVTTNNIELPTYPQNPALELTEEEIQKGLKIFDEYLKKISIEFPNKKFQLLYIPAVSSVYDFKDFIYVRSYKKPPKVKVDSRLNVEKHEYIKKNIKEISINNNWSFCDSSDYLKSHTAKMIPVHGPKDWAHFNRIGYESLAEAYINCF